MSDEIDELQKVGVKLQKEFVKKRYRELNKGLEKGEKSKLQEKIEACAKRNGEDNVDWKKARDKITKALQKCNLTINFKATSWFLKPNGYASYTQMYQRSIDKDTNKAMLQGDDMNPAHTRAKADDLVTLPKAWKDAPAGTQRKKLWDAMSYTGATDGFTDSTAKDMKGGLTYKVVKSTPGKTGSLDTLETTNPKFNPHAKQVFTALNYGRRVHGSSTAYGMSHLILSTSLKKRSLYFPEDTFYYTTNQNVYGIEGGAARAQVTYDRMGDLMLWAKQSMEDNIWKACYLGQVLPDTSDGTTLLEAHVFSDIQMGRDVDEVVLTRETGTSEEDWKIIMLNACVWAGERAVRVLF